MQINTPPLPTGEARELVQALLRKQSLAKEGTSSGRLIESTDEEEPARKDERPTVGRYLDVKA